MYDLTREIWMARLQKPRNQARVAKVSLQSRCLQTSQYQRVTAWNQTPGRTMCYRQKRRGQRTRRKYQPTLLHVLNGTVPGK
jgi:hypothetical protein